jgi:hypothetical protein
MLIIISTALVAFIAGAGTVLFAMMWVADERP